VRVELYDVKRTKFVAAHDGTLACLALTLDGTRLATASDKGTIVRIFNTAVSMRAHALPLPFNPPCSRLSIELPRRRTRDKGTIVRVFRHLR
jgi:hypothetical protein